MQFKRFLQNPITQFFLCLVSFAIALSGRTSMTGFTVFLISAWGIGIFGFETHKINYRLIVEILFSILILFIWTLDSPTKSPIYSGILFPQGIFSCFSKGELLPRIEIGNSGAEFIFKGKNGIPIFGFSKDREENLIIEKINGKLKVSTQIYNKNGDLIAYLNRNEWHVVASLTLDRNYSDNALEVEDSKGHVVLQVFLLPYKVEVQGVWWWSKPNNGIYGVRLVSAGKDKGFYCELLKNINGDDGLQIKPIFQYPSDLHFGELIKEN